jgi:hypothetical protein
VTEVGDEAPALAPLAAAAVGLQSYLNSYSHTL